MAKVITTRYQNKGQLTRFKAAAKARRWSLNTFMLVAAEQFAEQIEEELADSRQSSSDSRESVAAE